MAYKIIDEYKKDSLHELTIYKYNINHDCMMRYIVENGELKIYVMDQYNGFYQTATSKEKGD